MRLREKSLLSNIVHISSNLYTKYCNFLEWLQFYDTKLQSYTRSREMIYPSLTFFIIFNDIIYSKEIIGLPSFPSSHRGIKIHMVQNCRGLSGYIQITYSQAIDKKNQPRKWKLKMWIMKWRIVTSWSYCSFSSTWRNYAMYFFSFYVLNLWKIFFLFYTGKPTIRRT